LMVCSLAAQPNAERRYERRLFEKSRHRLAADSERVGAGRSGGVRAQGAEAIGVTMGQVGPR
jgi:hypothetical protein